MPFTLGENGTVVLERGVLENLLDTLSVLKSYKSRELDYFNQQNAELIGGWDQLFKETGMSEAMRSQLIQNVFTPQARSAVDSFAKIFASLNGSKATIAAQTSELDKLRGDLSGLQKQLDARGDYDSLRSERDELKKQVKRYQASFASQYNLPGDGGKSYSDALHLHKSDALPAAVSVQASKQTLDASLSEVPFDWNGSSWFKDDELESFRYDANRKVAPPVRCDAVDVFGPMSDAGGSAKRMRFA